MMVSKNWVNRDQCRSVASASASPHSFSVEEKILVMEALDHVFVSRQYQDVGLCAVCRKISIKKCASCGTHYCSSECQAYDWPKHKVLCTKNQDNISERSSFSSKRQIRTSSPVHNFSKDIFCKERLMISGRNSPFASLANQVNKESAYKFSGSKSLANFKFINKQTKIKANHVMNSSSNNSKKSNYNNEPKKTSTPKKSSNPSSSQDSPVDSKDSPDIDLSPAHKTVDTMIEVNNKTPDERWDSTLSKSGCNEKNKCPVKPMSMNLPKIWNKNVIGMYRESSDRYWVMDLNSVVKYEEIQLTLAEECDKYEFIIPTIGLLCGCKYADEWYRARVLTLTPELTVHFVDYGNTSVYSFDLVKELPDKLKSIPPLVFLIQFDESTPSSFQTNDLDSLKFTIQETKRTVDGICCVKIISGPTGAMAKILRNKSPLGDITNNIKSVMDTLKKNSTGLLFLVPGNGGTRYGSLVPEESEDAKECIKNVLNIKNPNSVPIEAKNGDLVLVVDRDGNDQRGKVLSKLGSTYYVQLIDCGNIITTGNVYALADKFKNLIELGTKITVKEIYIKGMMEMVESCFFSVIGGSDSGVWPCTLKSINDEVFAKVTLEKPIENTTSKPSYFRPKSGSTVEITHFNPSNQIYVKVIDAETEQKFLELNMEVLDYAARAKPFPIPPPVGEICCAKFLEDGCFYRVVVNSVQSKSISVLFVDFGNEQDTDLKDMKPLPEALKIVPFFAIQVHLSGVSDKSWNDSVVQYFSKLVNENVELVLTYNESLSNGVMLTEKATGTLVNKVIEESQKDKKEKPIIKDSFKKSEIFLDDDIEYTSVAPGTVCSLAILYVSEVEFESNYSFWATIAGTPNFDFVNSDLSVLLSEYCNSTTTPYHPSFRELCVAEFEGFWYRAMSAGNDEDFYKIFFLDFGNVCNLKATSIRKMKKELMKAPALAMNCTIVNREKLDGKPNLLKKVYEALLERLNTVIENVTVIAFENDTFVLKIPEIEAILSA